MFHNMFDNKSRIKNEKTYGEKLISEMRVIQLSGLLSGLIHCLVKDVTKLL